MKYSSEASEKQAVLACADAMVLAARTAPKAVGLDSIVCCVLDGEEKAALADKMREIAERDGKGFFKRDAGCTDKAQAVFLIGIKDEPVGMNGCGLCGAPTCGENSAPCVFKVTDLGIALGSAVARAADFRVDNRVLYSGGMAAQELKLLGESIRVAYAVPLAAYGKNIFFDR